MKLKSLPFPILALCAFLLFSACNRDKDAASPSNTKLLTAHKWQGSKVLMMGLDLTESDAIRKGVPDVRTLELTFKEDHTYMAVSEGIVFEGNWKFNADESKIDFDFLNLGEVEVSRLTEDELGLVTAVSKGQVSVLATLLNLDLGLLNRLPDQTQIETEIRFVKP